MMLREGDARGLLAASSRGELDCAIVRADVIPALSLLQFAAARALHAAANGAMKARTVHAELMFSLCPVKSVSESFRRFGVSKAFSHSCSVLVARVVREEGSPAPEAVTTLPSAEWHAAVLEAGGPDAVWVPSGEISSLLSSLAATEDGAKAVVKAFGVIEADLAHGSLEDACVMVVGSRE
jgi:hypothetical protein